ncbi:hypothetical protein A3O11_05640 [Ligilactobacillus aviarius]|uniref:hypothetical protein n=1 Tax=Ligilactobacillus aviarius TaxID=1606 RepID=UPI0007DA2BF6|nr:hypothetical protein [Ligilactobacillus aviarius]OAQ01693.1 hypothetical protein A3O10_02445 [Ligilactobacillus aviarius]OAQ04306.1 hypothetical protein A3O11_05640 [Ligilactobacillus aviarius]OAS81092.1 hypothetical protein A3O18_00035 [Ligilactobacillus aviarius]PEG71459.1 hypothetical protein A3P04_01145 [Ligilactobacillus aviarius]PEG74369.1 hypothetical protein A3O82_01500 [Ligilactobacillus aviarius]
MRAEKYEGIDKVLVIDDRGEKAVISKGEDLEDKTQLANQLQARGKSVNQAREELITKSLTNKLKFAPARLKEYFAERNQSDEVEKIDKLTSTVPSQNFKKISNEVEFFGQSFLEGFLDFYGIELDNAVKDYERRLHIIEQVDLNNHHKAYYLGTVIDNDLKLANEKEPLASREEAEEVLQKFSKSEAERDLSATLQRREEKDDENE